MTSSVTKPTRSKLYECVFYESCHITNCLDAIYKIIPTNIFLRKSKIKRRNSNKTKFSKALNSKNFSNCSNINLLLMFCNSFIK